MFVLNTAAKVSILGNNDYRILKITPTLIDHLISRGRGKYKTKCVLLNLCYFIYIAGQQCFIISCTLVKCTVCNINLRDFSYFCIFVIHIPFQIEWGGVW